VAARQTVINARYKETPPPLGARARAGRSRGTTVRVQSEARWVGHVPASSPGGAQEAPPSPSSHRRLAALPRGCEVCAQVPQGPGSHPAAGSGRAAGNGGRASVYGARLCSVVPSDRTRANGHKLKPGKFRLNMRKNFFTLRVTELWNRLPREVVESPSLEILKTRLDKVLCSLL